MNRTAARGTRLALGVAALAVVAGCGSTSSSGASWSTATSASANGGMSALVSAAKAEGKLNVIALPLNWADYGQIIKQFTKQYGIKVNRPEPATATARTRSTRSIQLAGTSRQPDVVDLGANVMLTITRPCSRRTRS